MELGTWGDCPICGKRDYSGLHRCKPQWEVRAEDEPDEWMTIRTAHADDAACAFVHRRDSFSEYGRVIAQMRVLVRKLGDPDTEVCFEVWGEVVPSYTAVRTAVETGG